VHGGGGFVSVRQAVQQMRYARPWQQMLFAIVLLLAGIALVIAGAWVGLMLVLIGLAFSVRCVRLRLNGRSPAE
jgi:hypothetical protein